MSLILDIEKQWRDFHLKIDLNCDNEVLSLLGASGCGKSVTLKCIAGIIKPDRGRIVVDGNVLFDSDRGIDLPVQKRRTGLLFQNFALFPNMTVEQNIRMGAKRDGKENGEEVVQILERFGLNRVKDLYPAQISGGQQQRTALVRMLISKPDILLFDEPFSALDSHLRFRMEEEIRAVIRSFGKTVVLVSHNRDEVFRLSDRVAVLKSGGVDRSGTRQDVFHDPQTCNTAMLTGCKNISPVKIVDEHHLVATDWGLDLYFEKIPEDTRYIGIRMHYICAGEGENAFSCDVEEEIENPFSYTVMLKLSGGGENLQPFGWEMSKEEWKSRRSGQVLIHIPQTSVHFLKE